MSRRIEVELTSERPDGSWTWRAAGAREPKGELDGGLPDAAELRRNAQAYEAEFVRRGTGANVLIPMMRVRKDWNPSARVLTDQYSPSNLLNANGRGRS